MIRAREKKTPESSHPVESSIKTRRSFCQTYYCRTTRFRDFSAEQSVRDKDDTHVRSHEWVVNVASTSRHKEFSLIFEGIVFENRIDRLPVAKALSLTNNKSIRNDRACLVFSNPQLSR